MVTPFPGVRIETLEVKMDEWIKERHPLPGGAD